jgi:hypothetical protein
MKYWRNIITERRKRTLSIYFSDLILMLR